MRRRICVALPLLLVATAAAQDSPIPETLTPYPLPAKAQQALTQLAAETDVLVLGETHGTQEVPQLAAGLLGRVVRVQLSKPKRVQDRLIYQVQIANDSPLVLNGLALCGPEDPAKTEAKTLSGLSLPPHKTANVPMTSELVQRLGLKDGVRVIAVNLSGL